MRVISGIQPSGKLHLGNYFGMMKPALALQGEHQLFLFIADYHALTTVREASRLREDSLDVALDFMACGLDPEKTAFFRQSDVPEVTELTWLLSVVTPMGLLQRCHSYKDKLARGIAATHGLFSYPLLMAADILAYRADLVPVGRDQKQHIEVTRDIVTRFNQAYGEILRQPEPLIREEVAVVPGIDGQKMSKTYGNTLDLFAPEGEIRKRIMRIVTDSAPLAAPKDPDKCNLFALYRLFAGEGDCRELARRYQAGGLGYGEVKKMLAELFEEKFKPMRLRRAELALHPDRVEHALRRGAEQARQAACEVLHQVRRAVGLGRD